MNYTTAVFLINSDVRAIVCTYECGDNAPRTMFKTLDKSVKVGDLVAVPTDTRHKMTACKVVEVDVDVDFDNPCHVSWIVSKIDQSGYQSALAGEADAIVIIKSAEKTKKRNELRNSLLADSAEALKALPITVMPEALPSPG